MEKDYVGLEQKVCPVTGKVFDSGILLDTRLKKTLPHKTVTGYEISPEVREKINEGYIALVGCDESKSDKLPNGNISPEGAYRTGAIMYIKKEAARQIFNTEITTEFAFCDAKVIKYLENLVP